MASIKKLTGGDRKGERYSVRWKANGNQYNKTVPTLADARRLKATVEADLARGDWLDPKLGRTPFAQVADAWLATRHGGKERTRAGYVQLLRNHVLLTFENTPVARIDRTAVRSWIAEREAAGVGLGTIRNALRNVLKPALDVAVEQNLIRSNPAAGIRLPRPTRDEMLFLTAEQVELLANEITEPYGLLVTFAAYTGLRAGEVCALRVGNLDLMRKVVHVKESVTLQAPYVYGPTKTYAERTVSLPTFLVDALTASEGKPLVYGTFCGSHFRPAVRRAFPESLHGLRFHDLRHTCAALMVNLAGADPYLVMKRMGHSSITVTYDRYAKLFPERDAEITTGLDAAYRRAAASEPEPVADVLSLRQPS
ncbi:MAG: site-specific integrase [Actinobacteria bacterium]|nr:site-specific integrase [Actinomycetota bacterium]